MSNTSTRSLLPIMLVSPLPAIAPIARTRTGFLRMLRAIWVPGLGLAFSSVGFGAITTFIMLLYAQRGWEQGWAALTTLTIAFAGGRVVFGHLPDRIGGATVSLVCVLIEAAGQAFIWLATSPVEALVGSALTGLGYSLVYPGLGIIAVRQAPPESRGLASGAYTACLDLALGVASPALGFVASRAGLDTVFLVSTLVVLCAAVIAARLLSMHARRRAPKDTSTHSANTTYQ
jgi:MFS family permease